MPILSILLSDTKQPNKALAQLSSEVTQRDWTEPEMLQVLSDLCDTYAANDQVAITRLGLDATAIGETLNRRG